MMIPELQRPSVPAGEIPVPRDRPRRLRRTESIRALVRETRPHRRSLIAPLFVQPGASRREPIGSMPGVDRLSPDEAVVEARRLESLGIGGLILFGLPAAKDADGSGAWIEEGIVQETLRRLRDADLDLVLIADTCLCEYTDHGHCGPLRPDGRVDNDAAIAHLAHSTPEAFRTVQQIADPVLGVWEIRSPGQFPNIRSSRPS